MSSDVKRLAGVIFQLLADNKSLNLQCGEYAEALTIVDTSKEPKLDHKLGCYRLGKFVGRFMSRESNATAEVQSLQPSA